MTYFIQFLFDKVIDLSQLSVFFLFITIFTGSDYLWLMVNVKYFEPTKILAKVKYTSSWKVFSSEMNNNVARKVNIIS